MPRTVTIDPLTRIEGHLAIKIELDGKRVTNAYSSGEMFRGFEQILKGRDPLDAQQITQRICGVCPVSHGIASIKAQDNAYGITPPDNGRIIRNLILGANYIQSHIVHFYHLSALDFVDIAAILKYGGRNAKLRELKSWVKAEISSKVLYPAAPFLPRYSGTYVDNNQANFMAISNYVDALEMRKKAQEMAAIFAGKLPHVASIVPGGVTEKVTAKKIAQYISKLKDLQTFVNDSYLQDVLNVAGAFPGYFKVGIGCKNFLSYGVFPETSDVNDNYFPAGVLINGRLKEFDQQKITEDVFYSMFDSDSGLHPSNGKTDPNPDKQSAYSWLKAPRYDGKVMEVGPLARMLVAYHKGHPEVKKQVNRILRKLNANASVLVSVLGRHAARAIECKIVAGQCMKWAEQLVPGKPAFADFEIPKSARGFGLTEAPRGALGHWLEINDYKISNYQCVVPTTWNCSPRDDKGKPGAVEQALKNTGVYDDKNPIEATRVVRSFDPCIACAVH